MATTAATAASTGTTATAAARAATLPQPMSFRDVLRIDVMRRVWYAQIVSLLGDWLVLCAVLAVLSFTMHGAPRQNVGLPSPYMLPLRVVRPIARVVRAR